MVPVLCCAFAIPAIVLWWCCLYFIGSRPVFGMVSDGFQAQKSDLAVCIVVYASSPPPLAATALTMVNCDRRIPAFTTSSRSVCAQASFPPFNDEAAIGTTAPYHTAADRMNAVVMDASKLLDRTLSRPLRSASATITRCHNGLVELPHSENMSEGCCIAG